MERTRPVGTGAARVGTPRIADLHADRQRNHGKDNQDRQDHGLQESSGVGGREQERHLGRVAVTAINGSQNGIGARGWWQMDFMWGAKPSVIG